MCYFAQFVLVSLFRAAQITGNSTTSLVSEISEHVAYMLAQEGKASNKQTLKGRLYS